jgi:hypothetical protein
LKTLVFEKTIGLRFEKVKFETNFAQPCWFDDQNKWLKHFLILRKKNIQTIIFLFFLVGHTGTQLPSKNNVRGKQKNLETKDKLCARNRKGGWSWYKVA